MGSVTNSILSGTSGRTGRIIIANVPDVEVSRARPVTPGSFTGPQTVRRELFRFAVAFLGLYRSFARLFFGKRKGLVTPCNQAQANVMERIRPGSGDVVINYNQVPISKGTLPEMIPGSMSAGAAQAITVTWINNAPPASTNESDLCPVFVYVPSHRDGQLFSGIAARPAGTACCFANLLSASLTGDADRKQKYKEQNHLSAASRICCQRPLQETPTGSRNTKNKITLVLLRGSAVSFPYRRRRQEAGIAPYSDCKTVDECQ